MIHSILRFQPVSFKQFMVTLLTMVALLSSSVIYSRGLPQKPEGEVNFMVRANTSFNSHTQNPTNANKAWMRENYDRMLAYTSYFDNRTSWFPNAWVYNSTYALKPGWSITQQHPEWILRDSNGNPLYIPWGCSGGTCPQYAGDFGNPAFRSWWINNSKNILNRGYTGMYLDDANFGWRVSNGNAQQVLPIDPRTGQTMTLTNWRRYMAEFMEQIRAAIPNKEFAHNMVWYTAPKNDPYLKRAIKAGDFVHLERGGSDQGLRGGRGAEGPWGFMTFLRFIDAVHNNGGNIAMRDIGKNTTLREYGLATWLLISKGKDILGSEVNSWYAPPNLWAGYKLNLGNAQENWTRQSNGLLRRNFACGVVYLNMPEEPAVTQSLGTNMQRINGSVVNSVRLNAKSAAVLKKINCSSTNTNPPPVDPPPTGNAENLNTWTKANGTVVTSLGNNRYRLTHPGRNWPLLKKKLPAIAPGQKVRIQFKGSSSPGGGQLSIFPWSLAVSAGGHMDLTSSLKSFDKTYTNNTGSTISNAEMRFFFPDSYSSGSGQTIIVENLVVSTNTSSTSSVPDSAFHGGIKGKTLTTPYTLSGTASAGDGVDYVWISILNVNTNQWWAGNRWQAPFTRVKVPTANRGVNIKNTTWSYRFAPPTRNHTYQAQVRTIDMDGDHDPTVGTTWFKN